jgi:hypothetical protein
LILFYGRGFGTAREVQRFYHFYHFPLETTIYFIILTFKKLILISYNLSFLDLSLYSCQDSTESVSAQGREGRGFDSDPGRNLK